MKKLFIFFSILSFIFPACKNNSNTDSGISTNSSTIDNIDSIKASTLDSIFAKDAAVYQQKYDGKIFKITHLFVANIEDGNLTDNIHDPNITFRIVSTFPKIGESNPIFITLKDASEIGKYNDEDKQRKKEISVIGKIIKGTRLVNLLNQAVELTQIYIDSAHIIDVKNNEATIVKQQETTQLQQDNNFLGGVTYKIVKHGTGSVKIIVGNVVEFNILSKIGNLVIGDSRKENKGKPAVITYDNVKQSG